MSGDGGGSGRIFVFASLHLCKRDMSVGHSVCQCCLKSFSSFVGISYFYRRMCYMAYQHFILCLQWDHDITSLDITDIQCKSQDLYVPKRLFPMLLYFDVKDLQ